MNTPPATPSEAKPGYTRVPATRRECRQNLFWNAVAAISVLITGIFYHNNAADLLRYGLYASLCGAMACRAWDKLRRLDRGETVTIRKPTKATIVLSVLCTGTYGYVSMVFTIFIGGGFQPRNHFPHALNAITLGCGLIIAAGWAAFLRARSRKHE